MLYTKVLRSNQKRRHPWRPVTQGQNPCNCTGELRPRTWAGQPAQKGAGERMTPHRQEKTGYVYKLALLWSSSKLAAAVVYFRAL